MLGKLFSFRGRLGRFQYWKRLGIFIGIIVLIFIILALFGETKGSNKSISGWGGGFLALLFFVGLIITLSANVRRLHDLNRSGWWLALYLVGLFVLMALYQLNIITPGGAVTTYKPLGDGVLSYIDAVLAFGLLIYIFVSQGFFKGTEGQNKYGPDPSGKPVDPEVFGRQ